MCQQMYYTRCTPKPKKKNGCNAKVGNLVQIGIAIAKDNSSASVSQNATNVTVGNKVCNDKKKKKCYGYDAGNQNASDSNAIEDDAGEMLELRIYGNGEVYLNGEQIKLEEREDGTKVLNIEG